MRKLFLFIYTVVISATTSFAQLPPVAQALYDSAFAQDPFKVNYALNNGAQVLATPDGNSFYLKWFPTGSTPAATPLVVSLHGSSGYAFHEFYNWHSQAQLHGCGIIALQWYRGPGTIPPNDYFDDNTIYLDIDSALTKIGYPSGKALYHGFSRASARSYAILFKDMHGGKNYFCTVLSNAGGVDANYPLYAQIDSGIYGANVFAGKHWNLFCGGQDTNTSAWCPAMINTKTWLQGQGATVDIFIQDPSLDHNGFQLLTSSAYRDSILDHYLQCYNGNLSAGEVADKNSLSIFPNPFNSSTTIQFSIPVKNAEMSIYNLFGENLSTTTVSGNKIELQRGNLDPGVYFYRVLEENNVKTGKLFVTY